VSLVTVRREAAMTRLFPPRRRYSARRGLACENIFPADSNGSARSPDPCINGRTRDKIYGKYSPWLPRGSYRCQVVARPLVQANEVLDQLP